VGLISSFTEQEAQAIQAVKTNQEKMKAINQQGEELKKRTSDSRAIERELQAASQASARLASNLEIKRKVLELTDTFTFTKKNISALREKSININSAKLEELIMLPGIGEKTAEKIIELRKERGKFNTLEELMNVKGIGEVKFNKIKKFLYIK
jgi:comEA protein